MKNNVLTHLTLGKMATISQTTVSRMKVSYFHSNFIPKSPMNINPEQATSYYLKQYWPSSLMHIWGVKVIWGGGGGGVKVICSRKMQSVLHDLLMTFLWWYMFHIPHHNNLIFHKSVWVLSILNCVRQLCVAIKPTWFNNKNLPAAYINDISDQWV